MEISDLAIAQFTSKTSSAGVVKVMFGFVPDFALLFVDHGGTNPNQYWWFNNTNLSQWAAALSLLTTGSTGVVTRVTSGITAYAGGDIVVLDSAGERWVSGVDTSESGDETTNSDPKHVDQDGAAITGLVASSSTGASLTGSGNFMTQAGLSIPAALQVAGGANIILAARRNR
jgi:galactokinase